MSNLGKFRLNLSDIDNSTITFDTQGRIQAAGGAVNVQTVSGDTGGVVGPSGGNIELLGGTGLTVDGDPLAFKEVFNVKGGGVKWQNITVSPQAMSINTGYVSNDVGLIQLSLPASSAFGDVIKVSGFGSGGWQITQAAGQQIFFGTQSTTLGATGSLSSANRYDSLELLCLVANTTWKVINSEGAITFA